MAALESLPELYLVGLLVAQTAKAPNHGKKSSKVNQDCTICRTCRWLRSDSSVLK